ncbi:MAG: hypothetical protein O2960_09075 [Verrucomicrobia bacterium]|nr:hypothetical protein [Verrucomicrobiota bacterium]
MSFYWKLSAISGWHKAEFWVNSTLIDVLEGADGTGWQFRSYSFGSRSQWMRWDSSESSDDGPEAEYAYLDRVRFEQDSDTDGLPDNWEAQYFGASSKTVRAISTPTG